MTQAFIDGFMSKCAEAGLTEKQADTLLRKQAGIADRLGNAAFNAFPGLGFLRKSYQSYLDKRKPGRVNGVLQGGGVPPVIPQQLRNPMPKSAELKKQAGLGGLARSAIRFAGRHPRVATLGGIAGSLGLAGALDNVVGSKLRPPRPLNDYSPSLNRKALPALGNLEAYYHEFPEERDKFKNSFDDGLKRDIAATAYAPNDYVYNPAGVGRYDFSPAVSNVAGRVIGNMPKQFQTPQMTNDVLNLFQGFRINGDYHRPWGSGSEVEEPSGSMWRPRLGDEALEPAPF